MSDTPTRPSPMPVPPPGTAQVYVETWPACSQFACSANARWAIASNPDGDLNNPLTSAFACRRHLSYVLENDPDAMDGMDQAVVIDLFEGDLS